MTCGLAQLSSDNLPLTKTGKLQLEQSITKTKQELSFRQEQ